MPIPELVSEAGEWDMLIAQDWSIYSSCWEDNLLPLEPHGVMAGKEWFSKGKPRLCYQKLGGWRGMDSGQVQTTFGR